MSLKSSAMILILFLLVQVSGFDLNDTECCGNYSTEILNDTSSDQTTEILNDMSSDHPSSPSPSSSMFSNHPHAHSTDFSVSTDEISTMIDSTPSMGNHSINRQTMVDVFVWMMFFQILVKTVY